MERDDIEKIVADVVSKYLGPTGKDKFKIPVSASNRHVHLSAEHKEILFGKNYEFQKLKDLSQPGQFACKECVVLCGKKSCIEKVRILGPIRTKTQVEISRTDSYKLGINPPVRDSGDVKNSAGIVIVGPAGAVILKEGVIIARRHIHMSVEDAKYFNLKDKDIVKVKVGDVIFCNVLVRVSQNFKLDMHLDIDEYNAIRGEKHGELIRESLEV